MARDFDRLYGDYRTRDYDRDDYRNRDYGNRGRGSGRDDARDLYSGGRYFYEGRTYASDRNRPGDYDRNYPSERPNWDRGTTYQEFTDRNFGTDYDRDRGYGRDRNYGYGQSAYDRDQSRYGYSRDYDRSRDWDYDESRSYDRGYGHNEDRRWDDAWNGYGYGPQDERRMSRQGTYGSSYDRGDYNRGEFPRTDYERSGYWRDRNDDWDRDYDRNRSEWQTGDRSRTRDYDSERDEDWGRQYDRNWGNSSFNPKRRREMETH
jgi:hypothetical protein